MLVVNYEKRKEMIENYLQENKHLSFDQNFKFLHGSSIMIDRFSKICSCYILYVFLFLCLVILYIFFQTLLLEGIGIFQLFGKSLALQKDLHSVIWKGELCIGDSHANRSSDYFYNRKWKELELTNILNICNRYKGLSGKKCIEGFEKILATHWQRRKKKIEKISSDGL